MKYRQTSAGDLWKRLERVGGDFTRDPSALRQVRSCALAAAMAAPNLRPDDVGPEIAKAAVWLARCWRGAGLDLAAMLLGEDHPWSVGRPISAP